MPLTSFKTLALAKANHPSLSAGSTPKPAKVQNTPSTPTRTKKHTQHIAVSANFTHQTLSSPRPTPTRIMIKAYMKKHNQHRVLLCRHTCGQDEEGWMAVKDMEDYQDLLGEFKAANGLDLSIKGKTKSAKANNGKSKGKGKGKA
ncbi:hypothetical protein BGZ47_010395 [Haplosporangium gracile]|nr:hypothetical protein BGZ47_010395 [Haplosporangium gracile]